MRLKDLRWHILAGIVIIIAYAAISLCYYLSIKAGKVETSMKAIAKEVSLARSEEARSKIDTYYDLFINDENNNLVHFLDKAETKDNLFEECLSQPRLVNKFNNVEGKKYLIAKDSIFNPQNTQEKEDANYYVYFQKDYNDSKLTVRISLNEFFTFDSYNLILFDSTNIGAIAYSSYGESLKAIDVTSLFGNDFANYFVDDVLTRVLTINDEASVITAIKFEGADLFLNAKGDLAYLYISTVIGTSEVILGADWIINQALIFYFVGVAAMIVMLLIMVLGAHETAKLLRADRRSTKKSKAMVIRIEPDGKVIYTNDIFKKTLGNIDLENVSEIVDVNTKDSILKTVKENKTFICLIKDIEDKDRYLEFISLYISRTYYLMGNEVTQDYRRRRHLELMSGKNEHTGCDNSFMLANKYESIIENNPGYDIAFIEYNIDKYDEIIGVFGQTNYVQLLNVYLSLLKDLYVEHEIYHVTDSKFIVVLPNTTIDDVTEKVSKTLDVLEKPLTIRENNIYVKSKVVIYNFKRVNFDETDTITYEQMRSKLDLAYRNMHSLSSKDYIVYDSSMDDVIYAVDEMEKDIEKGLENNEFVMYLQPQFDVVENRIVGCEALIRWNNPKYKGKSPQIFIELAEQRGHMLDIGRFVITESFGLAKKLEPYGITVSVNVSPVQLLQVGFVQSLFDEFDKNKLKPGSVAIELTETLLMENFKLVSDKLKLLRDKGFKIHLDDFLTGYSSMLYLKDLPIDTIKIDKEFTKHVETNKTNEAIVKAIINLANTLNLGLVCEGVENDYQKDIIKKMGCRVIQGYLIGKPMPYDDMIRLIDSFKKVGKK